MDNNELNKLEALAKAATPQNLDSAEDASKPTGYIECPECGGEGTVELTADYCNYDGKAMGVQFYGIGPEHKAAEAFFRAANPAAILELIALARAGIAAPAGQQAKPVARYECRKRHENGMLLDWQPLDVSSDEEADSYMNHGERGEWRRTAPVSAAPAAPTAELIELLRTIRPNYGAVGSRDVEVTAQRQRIDRAIELLAAPAAAQEGAGEVDAKDAARWRQTVQRICWRHTGHGAIWSLDLPAPRTSGGNTDEDFIVAIDAAIAAQPKDTTDTRRDA